MHGIVCCPERQPYPNPCHTIYFGRLRLNPPNPDPYTTGLPLSKIV